MRITNILEVDEDVFTVTFEDDFGTVSVITFHGKDTFDNFILEGITSGNREHTTGTEVRSTTGTSRNSMLRH